MATFDIIYKVDLATERYTYVSPSVKAFLGFEEEEILSKRVADTVTPESYSKQLTRLQKSLETGHNKPEIFEVEILHKDGRVIPVEIHVAFAADDQGRPVEIIGVARDISERKRAEAALVESERRYRQVVDTMLDGSVISNREGQLCFVNPAFSDIYQYSHQEALGVFATQVIHPDYHHV